MAYKLSTTKTWLATHGELAIEFQRWGVTNWSVKSLGSDPKQQWNSDPETRAVHLSFTKPDGVEIALSYNLQDVARDNLRVLFLAVEAMRLNEKRGIGDLLREAYLQLPEGRATRRKRDPYEVLGVNENATLQDVEDMYRLKARRFHPDTGSGDEEAMRELNESRDYVIRARRVIKA